MALKTATTRWITYSSSHTIVPTYYCFNHCTYCHFRNDEYKLITDEQVEKELGYARNWTPSTSDSSLFRNSSTEDIQPRDIAEILVLSGEVHLQSRRRKPWFDRIASICSTAIQQGFLPHTNAGPISRDEMGQLGQLNVSMGLMLESTNKAHHTTKGGIHYRSPSKTLETRLEQIRQAGELKIPFTTGLLLGLPGDAIQDSRHGLDLIAELAFKYDHIQEVILQPVQPRPDAAANPQKQPLLKDRDLDILLDAIRYSKQVLPSFVQIQIPANLMTVESVIQCLYEGATDLGGIGNLDHVSPDYAFPNTQVLKELLADYGFRLTKRLPLYPYHDRWIKTDQLRGLVSTWRSRLRNDQDEKR